jgi:hypothetical protein
MTDCHRFSAIFDAILLSISSSMENADIFISQILEFLLFTDPELREEIPVAFAGLSEMFSSACKHDTIEMSTVSECELSVNEMLLP